MPAKADMVMDIGRSFLMSGIESPMVAIAAWMGTEKKGLNTQHCVHRQIFLVFPNSWDG